MIWLAPWASGQQPAPEVGTETPVAETPAGEIVDEIVVVARRREESLQEVPLSLTVFDATALEDRSVVDITDVGTFTPNVTISTTGGYGFQSSSATAFIRGIGQLNTSITDDPAVGLYVDGVFLARTQGAVLDLLDVERVEVLRGPQGTLFGKNTTGGAISVVTRRPSAELGGRLSTTLGRFNRRDAQASVTGPLHEKLQASLALLATNRDGFSRSLWNGAEYNDDHRASGRLALRWAPFENVTVDLSGDYTREREAGSAQILLGIQPTPILDFYNRAQLAAGLLPAIKELWLTDNFYENYSATPSFVDQDTYGTSLVVGWQMSESLSLQTISSYRGLNLHSRGDLDAVPQVISEVEPRIASHQISQELQLSGVSFDDRLTWVLGGIYFRERPRNRERIDVMEDLFYALEAVPGPIVSPPGVPAVLCDPGPPPPGAYCFGGAGNRLNLAWFGGFGGETDNRLETESVALFGEATYDVSAKLSATFGIRYSRDDKWFDYFSTSAFSVGEEDLFNEDRWSAVTPRVSLAFQVRPASMLYLTAAKGYKSGGFNGRPQGSGILQPYNPEKVLSYEAGWKNDLFARRLRLNGAAFWSDYDDIHFSSLLSVNGQPIFVIQNAGRAEIRGFELELEAYPATGWNVSANVGYTDTELVEVAPGVAVSVEDGVSLPKSPEWSGSAAVQYAFDLGEQGVLIPRLDYSYTSKVYNDLLNSELIAQPAYGRVNARLAWTAFSGRWEVAGFVTNLTDEEYLTHGVVPGGFGFSLGVPGRPREWGMRAQWRF